MATFPLQIVTPDGGFYDGEAERLLVRTTEGNVCILPRHSPYVAALGIGEAAVVIDGQRRRAACAGGMLAVTQNGVRLVATTFEWADSIDLERARLAKERAEAALKNAAEAAETARAEAKLRRALTRIAVAGTK